MSSVLRRTKITSYRYTRRKFIAGSIAMATGQLMVTPAIAAIKPPTPRQTEGPFYPRHRQGDLDADLTKIAGMDGDAQGKIIYITGRVLDINGMPQSNALVDIWQANTHGRYFHEDDPSEKPLDPNFQGWAKIRTSRDGSYKIKTIEPGLYGGRARHIHFKISKPGFKNLTTQMYFKGENQNRFDGHLNNIRPRENRDLLIVDFSTGVGNFDIVLASQKG